jgi:hypothetical protein
MGTDASASAGYVSSTSLALAVKALNKTSTFEEACLTIRRAVSRNATPRATPEPECSGEALFEAVLRAGTVLRTRHLEGSAAWVHGDELFAECLRCEERFGGGMDMGKIRDLKKLSEEARRSDAGERDPEREADARRPIAAAFEGQLSGELEREFDRASSDPAADAMRAIRALAEGVAAGDVDPEGIAARVQPHLNIIAAEARARPDFSSEAFDDGVETLHLVQALLRTPRDAWTPHLRLERPTTERHDGTDVTSVDNGTSRRNGSHNAAAASDAVAALLINARTSTLDKNAVAALGDAECAVCRDAFEEGDRATRMPCSARHVFHAKCVEEWLKRDDSCPMCRAALPVWLGRETQYA